MKRKILFIFLVTVCCFYYNSSYSQGLQIISNNKISSESNDWDKYKMVRIQTSYNQQKVGKLQFRIYGLDDSLFLQSETYRLNDTIEAGEELEIGRIAFYGGLFLYGSFDHYFDKYSIFKPGNYRLSVIFHDTLYNELIDSVSTLVTIEDGLPSSNLFPYCYYPIYKNFMDSITFEWNKPKPIGECIYSYEFKIIEIDTFDLLNLDTVEHLILNNSRVKYSVLSMVDTFLNIPNLPNLLPFDKYYAWATRTFCITDSVRPLKNNNGYSVPFIFMSSSDTSKKLYKKGESCDDITNGFEDGNLDGWIGQSGEYEKMSKRQNRSKPIPHKNTLYKTTGFHPVGHKLIQGAFTDQIGNFPVPDAQFGNFALRLGNIALNQHPTAFRIRRTFTVTQKSKLIKLRIANVMHIIHGDEEAPTFSTIVYKGIEIGRETPLLHYKVTAGLSPNFRLGVPHFNLNNDWVWDWHCELINLEAFIGQTLTIEFISTNCRLQPCEGYTYIDFCGPTEPELHLDLNEVYCSEEEIIGHPEGTKNLNNWLWTIQKTNSAGTSRIGDEYITPWYSSSQVPEFNLSDFMNANGHPFECNSYYNIKLAGNNDCHGWHETTRTIFRSCPSANAAGPDKCCPNRSCNFQIGSVPANNYTYVWSPTDGLSNPNISNPYYIPEESNSVGYEPKKYTVAVTDEYGCTGYDEVVIYHQAPTNTVLTKTSYDLCSFRYSVTGDDIKEVEWKLDGTVIANNVMSIILTSGESTNMTVTAIVKNTCGSVTLTDVLSASGTFWSDFNNLMLWMPDQYNPSLGPLKIFEVGLAINAKPAYMATKYKIDIIDRYGGIHTGSSGTTDNNGFANGAIEWDGKIDGKSSFIPPGTYRLRLTLYNCRNPDHGKKDDGRITFKWQIPSKCTDWYIHPVFKKCFKKSPENPTLEERNINVQY